jgi:MFS family permease
VALYGAIFLFTAAEAAIHLLVPPFLATDLHLEPAAIGVLIGMFALASLAARVPIGLLYRPWRAPLLVGAGGLLGTAAYALIPFTTVPLLVGLLLSLDGIGWSIATTVLLAGLADSHARGRSTASAMGWYLGFIGLGNAAAGLGGILADAIGLRQAFLVLAVLPGLATVLAAIALRGLPGGAVPPDAAQAGGPAGSAYAGRLDLVRGAMRAPREVWAAAVVMVYINAVNGLMNAFYPVLALANGLSLSEIGILSSTRSLFSSWIRLGSGVLFRRLDAERLTTPLLVLGTAAAVVVPVVAWSFWLQIPIFAVVGLARGLLRVSGSAIAFDAARLGEGGDSGRGAAGMTSAIIQSGLDVGKLLGPVLAGVVAQVAGVPATFVILPVALALAYSLVRFALVAPRPAAAS